MEPRLVPINAVLGLLTPGDLNPAHLAAAGFRLAGLEVPIVGPDGKVVVDVVLFHPANGHLVLVEAKSGANIDADQAERYAALDAHAVVLATGVSVPTRGELTVEIVYACLAEHVDRVTRGLSTTGNAFAVISVDKRRIELRRRDAHPSPLDVAWVGGLIELSAPVTRIIAFDHESPTSAFEAPVRAQLVAELSRNQQQVTIRLLTERVVRQFALYASPAQRKLVSKVREVVRAIVELEPETYGYIPRTGTRQDDAVEFRKTPEDRDPRGRTRAYQALHGRTRMLTDDSGSRQRDLLDEIAEMAGDDDGAVGDDGTVDTVGDPPQTESGTEAQP